MGVIGLMTYLLENRHECSEIIDLIQVARERGFIEILTDFISFQHFALRQFWAGLSRLRQNRYLPILGGEYESQNKFFAELIRDLQKARIHLVFFVDGAKGSSTEQAKKKMFTWQRRHQEDILRVEHYISVCRGKMNHEAFQNIQLLLPVLSETDLFITLTECGCEVVYCPSGEADSVIAKAYTNRRNAYCILSNDSDFCVFPDCRMIIENLFDINGYLGLDRPQSEQQERPEKLLCALFSTEKLMQNLGLPFHDQLVEVSIVNGNDFTGHIMKRFHSRIGLGGKRTMPQLAAWVRRFGAVETHPFLSDMLRKHPEFRKAVEFSRKFYWKGGHSEDENDLEAKGYVGHLLENNVSRGVYPSDFIAFRRHFYWHRVFVEDTEAGQPCMEVELQPFRQLLYAMLLPPGYKKVLEHGRTSTQDLEVKEVSALGYDQLPPVHKVRSNQVHKNLLTFHIAMCILESVSPDKSEKWFERYGRKRGFLIYVLRYWLKLNWRRNLGVMEAEFLALVATVMGNIDPDHCQQICLRPTPRCVTLGNWFQDVYRHAYLFLGKALYLAREFPPPHEVFSGAVWTVFFTCSNTEAWNASVKMVSLQQLQVLESVMSGIVQKKRSLILNIVKDVPGFDNRF